MKINIIEPDLERTQKIRTCAYVRVSTDHENQEDSLENQTATYKRMIEENEKYVFVGIYADQGITGFVEKRPELQRMMEDARAGNIDLIITKSISRFARNTVTVLKFVRELKELGVGIIFEEQNIHTLSSDGELMLTVLSSFAQEEALSTSANNRWSMRKRFEQGRIWINTERFLGYDKGEDGNLVINPEQAKIVRRIFDMYLTGIGSKKIADILNEESIPTVTGGIWRNGTILQILQNEKYKGDFILQKYITPEGQMHISVPNDGSLPQYYIQDNHEPIVTREEWDRAQVIRITRAEKRKPKRDVAGMDKFKGLLFCPHCLGTLALTYNNGGYYYTCRTSASKGKSACPGIYFNAKDIADEPIYEETVVEVVKINGEKYYSYTRKQDFKGRICWENGEQENQSGCLLPGVHRPRRTAIKL